MKAKVTTTKKHIARKLKSLTGEHFFLTWWSVNLWSVLVKPSILLIQAIIHVTTLWIAVIHHIILDLYLTNHHVWSIFPLLFFKSFDSIKKNFLLEFACLAFLKPKFWFTLAWHKKNWISLHTSLNQNHYNGDIWQSQNPELRSVEIYCHHKNCGSRGITSRRKMKKNKLFITLFGVKAAMVSKAF